MSETLFSVETADKNLFLNVDRDTAAEIAGYYAPSEVKIRLMPDDSRRAWDSKQCKRERALDYRKFMNGIPTISC